MPAKKKTNNDVAKLQQRIDALEKENALHHDAFAEQMRIFDEKIKAIQCLYAVAESFDKWLRAQIEKDQAQQGAKE